AAIVVAIAVLSPDSIGRVREHKVRAERIGDLPAIPVVDGDARVLVVGLHFTSGAGASERMAAAMSRWVRTESPSCVSWPCACPSPSYSSAIRALLSRSATSPA